MKKGNNNEVMVEETKINITLNGDDVVVEVHGNAGQEKEMADYLVDGVIPTFDKMMKGMEVPDDLRFKIYTKWLKQITKRLGDLDLTNNY